MPVVDPLVGGPQQPLSSGHLTTQPSQKGHDLNHLVTGDFWEYPLYKVYMGGDYEGYQHFSHDFITQLIIGDFWGPLLR